MRLIDCLMRQSMDVLGMLNVQQLRNQLIDISLTLFFRRIYSHLTNYNNDRLSVEEAKAVSCVEILRRKNFVI